MVRSGTAVYLLADNPDKLHKRCDMAYGYLASDVVSVFKMAACHIASYRNDALHHKEKAYMFASDTSWSLFDGAKADRCSFIIAAIQVLQDVADLMRIFIKGVQSEHELEQNLQFGWDDLPFKECFP